jgi:hypothetical protein
MICGAADVGRAIRGGSSDAAGAACDAGLLVQLRRVRQ